MVLEDTGDVGVKLASLFITQKLATSLRAKHEVDHKVGEGL